MANMIWFQKVVGSIMAKLGFQWFFAGLYFHKGEFRKAGGGYAWLFMDVHSNYKLVDKKNFSQLTKYG